MKSGLLERVVRAWAALQPRERRLVGAGTFLSVLGLLYLVAFEPAWVGRQRLQTELPGLRTQLAQVESLAAEARQLSGQSAQPVESTQQIKVLLEQSIEAAGLKSQVTQLSASGELIDVRFKGVPFQAFLTWFDAALRETRLRAVDVAIEREATPGMAAVRLTLESARREP
jgi:general secretion pathway protein M